MATIRERMKRGRRVYHCQIRITGFPSRTETFSTRAKAVRWARQIEGSMEEGKHFRSPEARTRTVGEAVRRYLLNEVPRKRDGKMHRSYLPWWAERLDTVKLAAVTPALLVECRDELARSTFIRAKPTSKRTTVKGEPKRYPRSAATVDKYLACLSHVFTVARKQWHWMAHNPMEGVSRIAPKGKGPGRALNDDERAALFAATVQDPQLHTFAMVAIATAARAGELVRLEWQHVDLKEGLLLFPRTKNSEARAVRLYGRALELLREHAKVRDINGGRVFRSVKGRQFRYYREFKAAAAAAGIHGRLRFHDLRHTAATYMARQGASESMLRAVGGWKSDVVKKYVHLAAMDGAAALEKLAAKLDAKPDK